MKILTLITDLMNTQDLENVHATGFDLEEVKVTFLRDVKINVSGVEVNGKQGEILNVPRWVANVLQAEKHIEIQDADMVVELKQALSKEQMVGVDNISNLDPNFYIKLKAYMKRLDEKDYDKVHSMLNSLLRIRRTKIINLADSSKLTGPISDKLSVEEREFYNNLHNISANFTKEITGDDN